MKDLMNKGRYGKAIFWGVVTALGVILLPLFLGVISDNNDAKTLPGIDGEIYAIVNPSMGKAMALNFGRALIWVLLGSAMVGYAVGFGMTDQFGDFSWLKKKADDTTDKTVNLTPGLETVATAVSKSKNEMTLILITAVLGLFLAWGAGYWGSATSTWRDTHVTMPLSQYNNNDAAKGKYDKLFHKRNQEDTLFARVFPATKANY